MWFSLNTKFLIFLYNVLLFYIFPPRLDQLNMINITVHYYRPFSYIKYGWYEQHNREAFWLERNPGAVIYNLSEAISCGAIFQWPWEKLATNHSSSIIFMVADFFKSLFLNLLLKKTLRKWMGIMQVSVCTCCGHSATVSLSICPMKIFTARKCIHLALWAVWDESFWPQLWLISQLTHKLL